VSFQDGINRRIRKIKEEEAERERQKLSQSKPADSPAQQPSTGHWLTHEQQVFEACNYFYAWAIRHNIAPNWQERRGIRLGELAAPCVARVCLSFFSA